jgi:hypothetical protein
MMGIWENRPGLQTPPADPATQHPFGVAPPRKNPHRDEE